MRLECIEKVRVLEPPHEGVVGAAAPLEATRSCDGDGGSSAMRLPLGIAHLVLPPPDGQASPALPVCLAEHSLVQLPFAPVDVPNAEVDGAPTRSRDTNEVGGCNRQCPPQLVC